jgi:predicted metal-dependent enzyme (double-stranded beta helix superfamily)
MRERPIGRDLERPELRRLVARMAGQPEWWVQHVRHDLNERVYEQLHRDEHLAIWLICWSEDHDTGYHDHDLSAGAVAVVSGQVREDRLTIGRTPSSRTLGPGAVFDFRASDIHRVLHAGDGPAVTLHAYSPPLWRMGAYEIGAAGELRRHSISYAEELRPIEPGAAVPAA